MSLARNKTFRTDFEPLRHTQTLQLDNDKVSGPVSFLNPTQARFDGLPSEQNSTDTRTPEERAEAEVTRPWEIVAETKPPLEYKWTSRNSRKGRHTLLIRPTGKLTTDDLNTPPPTAHAREVLKGIRRMFTSFPIWDISYLVAACFTFGSLVWVLNATFVFLPFTDPNSEFSGEIVQGGGYTAFIGATIFELGSVLLMLEAVNGNRADCFG